MTWIKQHLILFIVLIALLAFVLWYFMSSSAPAQPILTTSTSDTGSPSAESSDQNLVATLLQLRAVTLSGTIFQDPAFISLEDFSTTIVPEPVGRPDPFAPLGRATSTLPDSPHAAQLFH